MKIGNTYINKITNYTFTCHRIVNDIYYGILKGGYNENYMLFDSWRIHKKDIALFEDIRIYSFKKQLREWLIS